MCIGGILRQLCDLDLRPHTHDFDLVVSWSKFEINLIGGWGGVIDMERKGWESIIHDHDGDLWVTMVWWVDVPYSDWGDFRCRRAVDMSSFYYFMFKAQNDSIVVTNLSLGAPYAETS